MQIPPISDALGFLFVAATVATSSSMLTPPEHLKDFSPQYHSSTIGIVA